MLAASTVFIGGDAPLVCVCSDLYLTRRQNWISAVAPAHFDSLAISILAANANSSKRDLLWRKLHPPRRNGSMGPTWIKRLVQQLTFSVCPPFFLGFLQRGWKRSHCCVSRQAAASAAGTLNGVQLFGGRVARTSLGLWPSNATEGKRAVFT